MLALCRKVQRAHSPGVVRVDIQSLRDQLGRFGEVSIERGIVQAGALQAIERSDSRRARNPSWVAITFGRSQTLDGARARRYESNRTHQFEILNSTTFGWF